jgi:hypothetical protein
MCNFEFIEPKNGGAFYRCDHHRVKFFSSRVLLFDTAEDFQELQQLCLLHRDLRKAKKLGIKND